MRKQINLTLKAVQFKKVLASVGIAKRKKDEIRSELEFLLEGGSFPRLNS